MSASFTEQLSCPQRIFVCFMQIATEIDVTTIRISYQNFRLGECQIESYSERHNEKNR